jgi:hypothetical protein
MTRNERAEHRKVEKSEETPLFITTSTIQMLRRGKGTMVVCLVEGFWVVPVDHQRRHVLDTLLNTIYVAENRF